MGEDMGHDIGEDVGAEPDLPFSGGGGTRAISTRGGADPLWGRGG